MKEIKRLQQGEIYIYKRDNCVLAAYLNELTNELAPWFKAKWLNHSYSSGDRYSPTALFFTEDVLNMPEYFELKKSSWGPGTGDYIKLPFTYNGRQYDCWIFLNKFSFLSVDEQEELMKLIPKYLSDEEIFKRGFFNN